MVANETALKGEAGVCELVTDRIRRGRLWGTPGMRPEIGRTHLIAPRPFPLTVDQVAQLQTLGGALAAFYRAANELYLRGLCGWVNEYLDVGKPEDLLRHARMNYQRRALPMVIRPDVLITPDGLRITELDSLPGGIGHLDCLSAAYEEAGFELVGPPRGMRDGFAEIIRETAQKQDPVCAIVVSDESESYRPEMTCLAGQLREVGMQAHTVHPRDLEFTEEGLFIETESGKRRIDVIYRFYELFDLLNVPKSELIAYAAKKRLVTVTPPYKPFLEEKLLLALLHNESLDEFWLSTLGESHLALLRELVSPTFVLDPRPVPPHAEISGFRWRGRPIGDWRVVADGTQKERRLAIKPSGFSPLAWGSRGVKVGQDMSQEDWSAALDGALGSFESGPWVLQPFHDTAVIGVDYHDQLAGALREMRARVRLCPYYFVLRSEARLAGVLATACPKDKKLIHGMTDAIMAPCSCASPT